MNFFLKNKGLILAKIFLSFGYFISIPGLWMMRHEPNVFQLSWVFPSLSLVILLFYHEKKSPKFWFSILLVGIIGWTIEAIGTNTGMVFGDYSYGFSLGFSVFQTPISMTVNWMLTIYMIFTVLVNRVKNILILGLLGASLMVLYDYLLEPVAIRFDMWTWELGYPPLQNYIAWFLVSFGLLFFLGNQLNSSKNPLAFWLLLCQFFFFGILNLLIHFFDF